MTFEEIKHKFEGIANTFPKHISLQLNQQKQRVSLSFIDKHKVIAQIAYIDAQISYWLFQYPKSIDYYTKCELNAFHAFAMSVLETDEE